MLRALEIFQDLESKAPGDVTDEWQQVVGRIEDLDEALRDADVDPATYDPKSPPADLGDEEKARIDAAARELGSETTQRAFGTSSSRPATCATRRSASSRPADPAAPTAWPTSAPRARATPGRPGRVSGWAPIAATPRF